MNPVLSVHELEQAEELWCRTTQMLAFLEEIVDLETKGKLRRTSKLLTFHRFLNPKGLLRVGGRNGCANLSYTKRHPILLSRSHAFTELLIRSEQRRLLHAGAILLCLHLCREDSAF